jgi:pimeloyl-ACP methyl ester carboxylesterase
MEALELRVGEYTFSARADGPLDGPLVLLLHGFPETSYEWRHQLPALAEAGYRAVAPDQRGYAVGARPEALREYRVEKLAADVVGIADELGADRFHLVGHDWGGAVAWVVGGNHADRLHTLTVVSTPHPTPFAESIATGEQREKSSYMLWFREPTAEDQFLADDAALLRGLYDTSGLHDADAAAEYLRVFRDGAALTGGLNWYRANDFRADIAPITVPTMYVWSTDDIALGAEAAHATANHCEGPYRFEILEGVSHWIPEEVPDVLNALLLSHLNSNRRHQTAL